MTSRKRLVSYSPRDGIWLSMSECHDLLRAYAAASRQAAACPKHELSVCSIRAIVPNLIDNLDRPKMYAPSLRIGTDNLLATRTCGLEKRPSHQEIFVRPFVSSAYRSNQCDRALQWRRLDLPFAKTRSRRDSHLPNFWSNCVRGRLGLVNHHRSKKGIYNPQFHLLRLGFRLTDLPCSQKSRWHNCLEIARCSKWQSFKRKSSSNITVSLNKPSFVSTEQPEAASISSSTGKISNADPFSLAFYL